MIRSKSAGPPLTRASSESTPLIVTRQRDMLAARSARHPDIPAGAVPERRGGRTETLLVHPSTSFLVASGCERTSLPFQRDRLQQLPEADALDSAAADGPRRRGFWYAAVFEHRAVACVEIGLAGRAFGVQHIVPGEFEMAVGDLVAWHLLNRGAVDEVADGDKRPIDQHSMVGR